MTTPTRGAPGRRPTPHSDVDHRRLERTLASRIRGEVRFDAGTRAMYSTDASNFRQPPIGVVLPRTVDDVVATVATCRELGAPITSRGGGTSLAGQSCNTAVILDFSKYMRHLLEIDVQARTARVQPGLTLDALRHATEKHGLTFGPDPATHRWCTLGGMIGNNSCGIHSVMAGRTADNVVELEVLTYDGVRMKVGATSDEELEQIIREGGRRGEIYDGLRALRDEHADEIRERYPQIPRRVSGYDLGELLPERGFHVGRALTGTEGTCVVVLEATLRLVPSPKERALLVVGYPSVFEAADHVPAIMEHHPIGLEGIDDQLIHFMREKGMPIERDLLPEGAGWLLVEVGGDSAEEANERAQDVARSLLDEPGVHCAVFADPERAKKVWEIRESGLGATANVPGLPRAWPGWEDAAVAPERLGAYLRSFRALLDDFGYHASLYGHFGQGCVHCRIDFELTTRAGIETYGRFLDRAADLVLRHGGSLSGEHGDGQQRAALLPKMFGPRLVGAFHRFKELWDPDLRMNPGKVVDPNPPDSWLRLGADYDPPAPKTFFAYPDDHGSFAEAMLRCVGVGKCRRASDAFMCPSFVATRDERESTRGRARALFEMIDGGIIEDGWRSDAVMEALDLCLGCKGCKSECPVGVDMATYKSEFLAHHYAGRLRPRHAYAMGLIDWWSRIARAAPRLANVGGQREPLATLLKWVAGVAQARRMPRFARRSFMQWWGDRRRRRADGPRVVLFADVFNDQFFPQTLRSAVDVLETVGYHVIVPGAPPAVRPLIHYGMLGLAARRLERIVAMMRPFADAGIPIVGLEPSTVSVLRDELPSLLPHDADAKLLSGMAMLLSELLDRDEVELPSLARRVVFHGHCHQKAVLNKEAALRLLRRMGAEIVEPEPGCCGMAGSFGYEAEHYDVSQAVAEQHLLPTVREAPPGALVVVEGFSCREQIAQGTGRRPMHVAEAIDLAIREARRRGQTTGVSRAPEPPSPPLWRTGAAAEVEHRT